jgi:hypothetical protein
MPIDHNPTDPQPIPKPGKPEPPEPIPCEEPVEPPITYNRRAESSSAASNYTIQLENLVRILFGRIRARQEYADCVRGAIKTV